MKEFTYALVGMFIIALFGYLIGSVRVKGVALGTAGVFLVAILYGYIVTVKFVSESGSDFIKNFFVYTAKTDGGGRITGVTSSFSHFENIGLVLFVTAVGFVAGPSFFHNLKKNFTSYISIGALIIVIGAAISVGFTLLLKVLPGLEMETETMADFSVGILSGALTSTPAFSAAKSVAYDVNIVSLGHAIAYPFGVVGVVLFVQLVPKMLRADPEEERAKMKHADAENREEYGGKLFEIDPFGLAPFAFAVILGILLGAVRIPLTGKGYDGATFSLGNTGGTLIMALVLGHFGRIGKISLKVPDHTVKVFREFGLMLFLIGAGVGGGVSLVGEISSNGGMIVLYGFLGGAVMTLIPMIIGFIFAKYVLKLPLFNNLGSICGGMTSTPALGTLISTTGTEDVAGAYAATYPIALILVVLASNLIVSLM
ncbi:MAG: permease [Clostridia bacterium]|nr:permease [Clostridia bacterium]